MSTIIAIPGSLRADSNNLRLLQAARELAPEGVELRIERQGGIPPYDGDVEDRDGIPERASELKRAPATSSESLSRASPSSAKLARADRERGAGSCYPSSAASRCIRAIAIAALRP